MKSTSTSIIFLDIDGVMNTYNQMWRQRRSAGTVINENWCPIACRNIKLLCTYFDARIVISSTWRIKRDLQELRQILEDNDINPDMLIGTTPILCHHEQGDSSLCRGDEIQHWLEENDCSNFVIIDDISESEFLEEQKPNLIIVDPNTGLAEKEVVMKAGKILNGS